MFLRKEKATQNSKTAPQIILKSARQRKRQNISSLIQFLRKVQHVLDHACVYVQYVSYYQCDGSFCQFFLIRAILYC